MSCKYFHHSVAYVTLHYISGMLHYAGNICSATDGFNKCCARNSTYIEYWYLGAIRIMRYKNKSMSYITPIYKVGMFRMGLFKGIWVTEWSMGLGVHKNNSKITKLEMRVSSFLFHSDILRCSTPNPDYFGLHAYWD